MTDEFSYSVPETVTSSPFTFMFTVRSEVMSKRMKVPIWHLMLVQAVEHRASMKD